MSLQDNENKDLSPVKRALLEIRELRERLERSEARQAEPIAIVGMGCRFPGGVRDPDAFWELLRNGGDAIVEMPADRWNVDDYYDPNPDARGKMSTRWGGFLDGVELFDPEFFNISAREAASLDPQQRLLLEVTWEALENAGIPPDGLLGSQTGVFTGIAAFDYPQLELQALGADEIDAYFATGGTHSVASGRISYFLGLKGPSVAIDTACSGSLVAVHLACQSLRLGECNLALAGGVSILLLPEMFVDFSNAHMMAADGRCKVFDAAADGYVRSEGCGVVVLKRLGDALADGDEIAAVIRGSAVNHDGRSNGLTAPNGPSQVAVIRSALEQAKIRPGQVGYVEAHGTGTSLGDPIEVQALAEALGADRPSDRPLLVGSVKTNVGHLEAAAGVAGLIKAALCLGRRELVPSLHFREPNPGIAWDRIPVAVATRCEPWEPIDGTRIAGVSSFGFSGTNAHVVLEEPPTAAAAAAARAETGAGTGAETGAGTGTGTAPGTGPAPSPRDASAPAADRPLHILTVTAKSDAALAAACERLGTALKGKLRDAFADAAHSANTGRAQFAERLAVIAASSEEAADHLAAFLAGRERLEVVRGSVSADPEVCFLFPGQGSQYVGMGAALFESEPVFRDALLRCDAILRPLLGAELVPLLYGPEAHRLLRSTRFAQPAIVSFEYALAELWRSWGIRPAAVAGHSLGEYAAAIVAGVLSVEDGLRLVAERARLVEERCPEGRMAAVRASEEAASRVLAEIGGDVSIAALNGPESIVVSGAAADLDRAAAEIERCGFRVQPLDTTRAFHHALLEPALAELAAFARTLEHRAPAVPFVSNRSGALFADGAGPTADYWADQARSPVRFHDGLSAAVSLGFETFLEVGPSSPLTSIARENFPATGAGGGLRWLGSLRRGRPEWEQLLTAVAALYVEGAPIDWRAFDRPHARRRVALPTYPFQRKRYWFTKAGTGAGTDAATGAGTAAATLAGARSARATGSAARGASASASTSASTQDSIAAGLASTAWSRALEAGRRQAAQVPIDLDLRTYEDRWALLDSLTSGYIVATLRDLGLFNRAGEAHSPAEIVSACGVLPMYESLVERWLDRLVGRGLLAREQSEFVARSALDPFELEDLEARARTAFPDAPYVVEYLRRCGAMLTAVITGKESALETLFPGGSRQTAVDLYRNWAMSRYCNEIVGAVAAAVGAQIGGGEGLEILEIGAGTGGTTASVLPLLPAERTTYWFTDVSEFFFAGAADDFAAYPFVRYGVLDIERAPAEQGYGRSSFHAVVAANVLHATKDLAATMRNVLSLLRPGGLLLLYEVTEPPAWIDTSVALIAGWAKSADGLRDNGPLLSASTWRRLLLDEGFADVTVFPEPGSPAQVLGLSVIVARAPTDAVEAAAPAAAPFVTSSKVAAGRGHEAAAERLLAALRDALPHERLDVLVDFVRDHVAAVLRRDAGEEAIGRRKSLMDLGIDSLMAIELRDRLTSGLALGKPLPASLIFDYPNIEAIAGYLAGLVGVDVDVGGGGQANDEPRAAAAEGRDGTEHQRIRAVESMTDDEIEAMLLKKLEGNR